MSKTSKTTLIIARHGNTFGPDDTPTRVGLHTNIPLVESGREQGRMLGAYLKKNDLVPNVVYSSGLKRAEETAQLAIEEMDIGVKVWPEAMFNEIDYGPDENKTEEEVITRIGQDALDAWNENATVPPGWHVDPDKIIRNWLEFGARCAKTHAGRTVLAVTSNGIARFAPHLTGDFDAFVKKHKIKLATGALAVLEHDGKKWEVKSWNIKPKEKLAKDAA